ncbi:MAG: hypothetical protein ACR2GY_10490 [Phycisphaerales bacterium]
MVVPDTTYTARFRVLGSQLTAGGKYDMPVTLSIQMGVGDNRQPFGLIDNPLTGNVNDDQNPREYIVPEICKAAEWFTVHAQSWQFTLHNADPLLRSSWKAHMSMTSNSDEPYVLALRDGDAVPSIPPYMNQRDISDILRDYIDPIDNRIRLFEDEIIYLFELGVTDLNSPAADFQDLVVLVTLAEDHIYFENPRARIRPTVAFD